MTSTSITTMNKSISSQPPYQIHLQNDPLRKGYIDKLYPSIRAVMHRNIVFPYNEHKERGWLYRHPLPYVFILQSQSSPTYGGTLHRDLPQPQGNSFL